MILFRSPVFLRLVSVFSLFCVLCSSASAVGFLYVDDSGGAADTVVQESSVFMDSDDPVYSLSRSPMAVMSAAATSDSAEWHVDKTGKQYFGYSTKYTGQWQSVEPLTVDFTVSDLASGHYTITYRDSDKLKSTIAYEFPGEFYIDVYKDVNYTETDAGYVYLNGVPQFYIQIYNGYGFFSIQPKSIHVLVNDSEYVSSVEAGSTVRQEIPVGDVFPEITKVGFRFYFAAGSGQKDTGTSSDVVYFQLVPRISNLSVTSSDKATGLLSGILAFLQAFRDSVVSFLSSIANFASAILDVLRSIWDFVVSSVSGIIRVFVLIAQSMVFLRNVIGLLPSVLLVFSVLGLLISIFLFFLGR